MTKVLLALIAALSLCAAAQAASLECIVPSKPGGAMDLTCKLAQKGLQGLSGAPKPPPSDMHISYLPGGIGAVAWHSLVSQRRSEPNTLVAFSGGSLLNLAQGKFGKAKSSDVRWVAALGADYGMIAVRADSPYKTLGQLVAALKDHPEKVLIGVSGTIGSQDWLKMAMVVKTAGVDPKVLRFVALEGGGEAFAAMHANLVQAVSGDASEATLYAAGGNTRVLAILAEHRLPGVLANVPTAREQGIDVVWPIIRGVWMGPQVSDADYQHWVANFDRVLASPQFAQMRAASGLFPFGLTGDALAAYVKKAVDDYGRRAAELGLVR
ncbi:MULTISPECIES: tripartite tricarboxylate transporter substrate binding protein [unclassified Duganella]|uniref:tripartite tricarboxylate transporter substrate binding protein n=1 Tax=unclassified Duganella TaxID=2636909 RepID=UPI000E34115B|nr:MULTISPECIES: tripartite tricarboxylate transporter substrate-binding protein [unclassified Duganella]RFP14556.1 tripartite tricarboxylate transporter substrate binding protein [Duganella sp. BJB475]RFP30904.1 tripartite tricarboxylate transporter substrate binding protein [Duganella sp. BJB476]